MELRMRGWPMDGHGFDNATADAWPTTQDSQTYVRTVDWLNACAAI